MNKIRFQTVLLVMLVGCGKQTSSIETTAPAEVQSLAVRTLTVAPRTFERRITVQGTLQSKYFANVAARIGGNLDAIFVDAGDRVEANKTELFQIDPVTLKNAVTASEQQLAVTQASLEVARAALGKSEAEASKVTRDFERFKRLHEEERVTDNEYELHHVQYEQAKAGVAVSKAQVLLAKSQVEQAAATLEISRKNLQDSKSIAPISGFVTRRMKEPGEQVSPGTVVLRIEDPSTIEAVAFLPAEHYADVTPNKTEARLSIAGKPAGTFIITYRSPVINPTLRTFEVKGRVTSPDAIAGAMAEMTIVFDSRKALGVLSKCILLRHETPALFVAKEGKATLKEITTGLVNDEWIEVTSGLDENESVIFEGQSQLREGMAISIQEQ